jgi:Acyl-CoA carboxylase epsilon subunit
MVVTPPAEDSRPAEKPFLRVVRGDATPEEVAALVAVIMARTSQEGSPEPTAPSRRRQRSAWSDRSRQLRASFHPAPGGWRRSALPG